MPQMEISDTSPKLLKNHIYDKLRITAQLLLPALAALYFALAQIWNLPYAEQVNGTIALVNTFLGVVVVWLRSLYSVSAAKYDGTLAWVEGEEEGDSILRMTDVNLHALENKGEVLFKVNRK